MNKYNNSIKLNINHKTYNLLFGDHKNLYNTNEFGINILEKIDEFTLNNKNVIHHDYNIERNGKHYTYYDENNNVIDFNKISDLINLKELKKELCSKKRYGKCHVKSFEMGPLIKNSKILTGYILVNNLNILHSIIEIENDSTNYILDWTKNLKINKETYIKLTKFKEISSINSSNISEDINLLKELGIRNLDLKTYLTFRDEIIYDANKQKYKKND